MCAQLSFVLLQITRLTDGRTDTFLVTSPRLLFMRHNNKVRWYLVA